MEVPCEACRGPGSGVTARENGLRALLLSSAVWKAALMDACLSLWRNVAVPSEAS